jgi:hypothetical protein
MYTVWRNVYIPYSPNFWPKPWYMYCTVPVPYYGLTVGIVIVCKIICTSYLWTCDLFRPVCNALMRVTSITRESGRGLGPVKWHRAINRDRIFKLLWSLGIDFQGNDSTRLVAGRYYNPIPTRFLAPIDCSKIPALGGGLHFCKIISQNLLEINRKL